MSVSEDGEYLVTGSYKIVKVWKRETGECIKVLLGHSD